MKTQKKIHVVTKYFYPVTAGIEVNIQQTYKKLVAKGWNVIIHTSKDTYLKKDCLQDFEMIQGLKVKRYPFRWYGFFPEIDYSERSLLCLHNFDMFPHFHLLLKAFFSNVRVVVTPHGGFCPEWSVFPLWQRIIKHTYHRTIGSWLINSVASMIRAVSSWEKQEMIRYGIRENLIEVIENGIEDEAYEDVDAHASEQVKQKVQSFGKYIIQIGRIYKIKNYETSIKMLAKFPQKDMNLVILGPVQVNDVYKKSLERLITRLGLENRVIFAGVMHGIDKYYLVKHARLMIHTAIWESFCNVVHEGLSQGLVCVVAKNTVLPYLVKDGINGYCVDTFDVNGFAEKVQYVLDNENSPEIKTMKEKNKVYGLQTSWTNVADLMDVHYLQILLGNH